MKQAGLIGQPSRGVLVLSPEGKKVLAENPARVDIQYLLRYPAFVEFRKGTPKQRGGGTLTPVPADTSNETPDDTMARLWRERRDLVAAELLDRIAAMSPAYFEGLVVKLLVATDQTYVLPKVDPDLFDEE